ncbi:hypothetical protein [Fervidobacterium sp.]
MNPTDVLRAVRKSSQQNQQKGQVVPLAGVTVRGNKRGPDIRAGFAHITDGRANLRIQVFPVSGVLEFAFPDDLTPPKEGTYSVRVPVEKNNGEAFWTTIGYALVEDRKVVVVLEAIPPTGLAVISFAETVEERQARLAKEKAAAEGTEEAEAEAEATPDFPEDPFQD